MARFDKNILKPKLQHTTLSFFCYFLFASLSLSLLDTDVTAMVWYANIIGGFLLIVRPRNEWGPLIFTMSIAHFSAGLIFNLPDNLLYATLPANIVEIWLIAYLLTEKEVLKRSLESVSNYATTLSFGVIIPALFSSTLEALLLSLLTTEHFLNIWMIHFLGSIVGGLSVFSLAIYVLSHSKEAYFREIMNPKGLIIISSVVLITILAFSLLPYPYAYISAALLLFSLNSNFVTLSVAIALASIMSSFTVSFGLYIPIDYGYQHGIIFFYTPLILTLIAPTLLSLMSTRNALSLAELEKSEASFRNLYEKAPIAMHTINRAGRITYVSDRWLQMLGYKREEVIGKPSIDFLTPESQLLAKQDMISSLNESGSLTDKSLKAIRKDGSVADIEVSAVIEPFKSNRAIHALAALKDITKETKLQAELAEEKDLLEITLCSIGDGVIATDQFGYITFLNPIAEKVLQLTKNDAIGTKFEETVHLFDQRTGESIDDLVPTVITQQKMQHLDQFDAAIRNHQGQVYCIQDSISPIKDKDNHVIGTVMVFQDVTETRNMSKKMEYLAHHDILTKLPNRALLINKLLALCSKNDPESAESFAVFFIDIDNLKAVNDQYGHRAGDDLLTGCVQRIQDMMSTTDFLARIGGDEFILIYPNFENHAALEQYSQTLLQAINRPINVSGHEIQTSASIGISLFPENGQDADTLLSHADAAMYHVKGKTKNDVRFYTPEFDKETIWQAELEEKIRSGLSQKEFVLHFQPIINSSNQTVTYFEALCRWDKNGEEIKPDTFIPIAEQAGLIAPLTTQLLHQACAFVKALEGTNLRVSFNISATHLQSSDFMKDITSVFTQEDVSPSYFIFEITETILMQNWERNVSLLNDLKQHGINIAVDDFGTGYSSLGYLKRFPIDILKIDREFIRELHNDAKNRIFVDAIISMAHALSLKVVAEGVENEEQALILNEMSCILQQGYYYSKPLPILKVLRHLNTNSRNSNVIHLK